MDSHVLTFIKYNNRQCAFGNFSSLILRADGDILLIYRSDAAVKRRRPTAQSGVYIFTACNCLRREKIVYEHSHVLRAGGIIINNGWVELGKFHLHTGGTGLPLFYDRRDGVALPGKNKRNWHNDLEE